MGEELNVFEMVRQILYILSPIIFVTGFILISHKQYELLEQKLAKQLGGIKKILFPFLENNIFHLHNWLLQKRNIIGLLCIISSLFFFFTFKQN